MIRAMLRSAFIFLSCLASALGAESSTAPTRQSALPANTLVASLPKPADLTAALLAETNRVRRLHGCRPLQPRPELDAAADDQAAFMALTFTAQHRSFIRGQETATDRVNRRGLEGAAVAENVAMIPVSRDATVPAAAEIAAVLVEQWMNSPGHRANLLSKGVTQFGGAIRLMRTIGGQWCAFGDQVFFLPRTRILGPGV